MTVKLGNGLAGEGKMTGAGSIQENTENAQEKKRTTGISDSCL